MAAKVEPYVKKAALNAGDKFDARLESVFEELLAKNLVEPRKDNNLEGEAELKKLAEKLTKAGVKSDENSDKTEVPRAKNDKDKGVKR